MVNEIRSAPLTYPFNEPESLELSPAYTSAREADGMVRVQLPFGEPAWLATRYADARLVLGDRRFSRAEAMRRDEPRLSPFPSDGGILTMDPPGHTRLRTLVSNGFRAHRVEAQRPVVRELVNGLLDDLLAGGAPADLVEHLALPLPVAVICRMLGVPVADSSKFLAWTRSVLSVSAADMDELVANVEALRAYMRGLIERHRAEPADDLMTSLIEARDQQDRLSEDELVDICITILIAGHETTATAIPNMVLVLLNHPDHLARLRTEPSLIPDAVEEILRFVPLSGAAGFPRYATEDVEVGGVLVRAGEPVLVSFGAANRDPLRFGSPEELRFDRENNQHIGFGHGVHHCLGAPLARLELQEAIGGLLRRLPGLRLAGDIVWKAEMQVRGPRIMPVAW